MHGVGVIAKEKEMEWYLTVLKRYSDFSGRSRRKEYWMFILINALIGFAIGIVDGLFGTLILTGIYYLTVLVPTVAVSIRRLHDTGRSGWWLLVSFVPIVGLLVMIYFTTMDSEVGENDYGPSVKGYV